MEPEIITPRFFHADVVPYLIEEVKRRHPGFDALKAINTLIQTGEMRVI